MKRFIAKYMLFIYLNFVKENWDDLKKWVIPFIKPAWFVRSAIIWVLSIALFPIFYVGMKIEEKMKSYDMEEILKLFR